jgi:hypothetical protein
MDIDVTRTEILFFVKEAFLNFFHRIYLLVLFFSDEMVNYLQRDYEYLQSFLSSNISDQQTVLLLIRSSSIDQISRIIDLLRTGEKSGSQSSSMKN